MASSSSSSSRTRINTPGPVELSIHKKITEALKPEYLEIRNDSSKHAHHSAMRASGGGNGETHFSLTAVSSTFLSKPQIARHRLVNTLLKEEFEQMGLHALSLRLKTVEEAEKEGIWVPSAVTCKSTVET